MSNMGIHRNSKKKERSNAPIDISSIAVNRDPIHLFEITLYSNKLIHTFLTLRPHNYSPEVLVILKMKTWFLHSLFQQKQNSEIAIAL